MSSWMAAWAWEAGGIAGGEHLHLPASHRVQLGPPAAGGAVSATAVDPDGMAGLHPLPCRSNDGVGRGDYVVGGAVVLRQVGGPGPVVGLEAFDELGGGAVEGIDVLVVVPHREDGELVVMLGDGAAGQCGDQGRSGVRRCPGTRLPGSSGSRPAAGSGPDRPRRREGSFHSAGRWPVGGRHRSALARCRCTGPGRSWRPPSAWPGRGR